MSTFIESLLCVLCVLGIIPKVNITIFKFSNEETEKIMWLAQAHLLVM